MQLDQLDVQERPAPLGQREELEPRGQRDAVETLVVLVQRVLMEEPEALGQPVKLVNLAEMGQLDQLVEMDALDQLV